MVWGAIAGAAIGAAADIYGQNSANKANIKMAREQMAFQERMRNTEMSARVKDLASAGLNPMLAVQQGGASSPSGARAEIQSVTGGRMSERIVGAVLAKAQLENIAADTQLKNSAAAVNAATVPQLGAQTAHQVASAGQAASQAKVLEAQIPHIAKQIEQLDATIKGQGLSNQLAERVLDLTVRLRAAEARSAELAIPAKEAVSEGGKALRDMAKATPGVLRSIGEAIGGSAADAADWLRGFDKRDVTPSRKTKAKSRRDDRLHRP